MRIIAGHLGGQIFDAPSGHRTHPMSDKMRGALFNALGDITGLEILDAFAGSGALSFEALSRGAKSAIAVDSDKSAHRTVQENIAKLGLENQVKAVRANVSGWSDNNSQRQFDLILCDPPYDQLQLKLLQKLIKHVKSGGLVVLSWPGKLQVPQFMELDKVKDKNFGDAQLAFYRAA